MHEFFQHENQSAPASLSDSGKLHTSQKSQLVEILESNTLMTNTQPEAGTIIIDGFHLVNSQPLRRSKTFDDYANVGIRPKIRSNSIKSILKRPDPKGAKGYEEPTNQLESPKLEKLSER